MMRSFAVEHNGGHSNRGLLALLYFLATMAVSCLERERRHMRHRVLYPPSEAAGGKDATTGQAELGLHPRKLLLAVSTLSESPVQRGEEAQVYPHPTPGRTKEKRMRGERKIRVGC